LLDNTPPLISHHGLFLPSSRRTYPNPTPPTMTKLFIKNFRGNISPQDIVQAIHRNGYGEVRDIQIRTSRRNIRHAVVDLEWNNQVLANLYVQGLLKMNETLHVPLPHPYGKYIQLVQYQPTKDTKIQYDPEDLDHDPQFQWYGTRILRSLGIE
jgi:hypothetical protein